ncbi:hypothetical protein [Mycobacterium paraense]|nr:hypothetical protein [Mycobacterium paraense]
MKLTTDETQWADLMAHTKTRVSDPPLAVVLAVAALLDDEKIKGSWVTFKPAEPEEHSTWAVFVATADRLIHVELQFDREMYNAHQDSQLRRDPAKVVASSARRLRDVSRIEIGACQARLPERGSQDWIGVGKVSLIFKDGERVDLPFDQLVMDRSEDRDRSDDLLDAIRAGASI